MMFSRIPHNKVILGALAGKGPAIAILGTGSNIIIPVPQAFSNN
jgi:hypothetical protein